MRAGLCILAAILLDFVAPGIAQTAPSIPGALRLTTKEVTRTTELGGVIGGPLHCDASGRLYIPEALGILRVGQPIIIMFSSDGAKQTEYSVTSIPGMESARVFPNAGFGPAGDIAALASLKDATYIVTFAAGGTFHSKAALKAHLRSGVVSTLPSGKLFIAGREAEGRLSAGVFDVAGAIVADVDVSSLDQQLDLASASTGPDGNAYLMQVGNRTLVHVVSPTGKIIRTIEVEAPSPNMRAVDLAVSGDRIAVSFVAPKTQASAISINDRNTGKRLKLYDATPLGTAFACYDSADERLTFLGVGHNQMRILVAEPAPQ